MFEKQQQQQQEIAAGEMCSLGPLLKPLSSEFGLSKSCCFVYSAFSCCPNRSSCCCCCSRRLKPWSQCCSPSGFWDAGHASDCYGSTDGSPSSKNTGRDWYCCAQLLQSFLCKPHEVCRTGEKEENAMAGEKGRGKIRLCCFVQPYTCSFDTEQAKNIYIVLL